MIKPRIFIALTLLSFMPLAHAQVSGRKSAPAKVILDTDIGDDIDDAYALALLLKSPEVKIVGITTAFGDTQLRARLVSEMLKETGNQAIPVFAGPKTPVKDGLTQETYALKSPAKNYPDAISFILDTIRKNPGEITLISIAPLTNIGALLQADPATFLKLKRVVMMGGSINRGYGEAGAHPDPEWNIICDIPAAKALFQSGVPLYVMPLDSTQINLDPERRKELFARTTPLTIALRELTTEWAQGRQAREPMLFDAVAASYAIQPSVCPTTLMRVEVDDKGMTRRVAGPANANVCLSSSAESFFDFYLPRVMQ
jgi:inosine-uridine nucleoside N-ribohydrolase